MATSLNMQITPKIIEKEIFLFYFVCLNWCLAFQSTDMVMSDVLKDIAFKTSKIRKY